MRASGTDVFCGAKIAATSDCSETEPPLNFLLGEVSERLKEPASKAGSLAKPGSWVQIPPSPPYLFSLVNPLRLTSCYRFSPISILAQGAETLELATYARQKNDAGKWRYQRIEQGPGRK